MSSDYYELLGVSASADLSTIRAAYRSKVKEYHPDTSEYLDSEALFKQTKTAYDVLNHREKRATYDQLGHDTYVDRHGGYTTAKLKQTTETNIQAVDDQTTHSERQWQKRQQDRLDRQQTAAESGSLFSRFGSYVIDGRTPDTNGTWPAILRVLIYLLGVVVFMLPFTVVYGNLDGVMGSSLLFTGILLGTRLLYLIGFEYLRTDYIKIDRNPEPDVYAIPYALGLGLMALLSIPILLLQRLELGGLPGDVITIVGLVASSIGAGALLIGLLWIVLSVGFGVADDYYNLQYDVNPIVWNFAVQAPILIAAGLLTSIPAFAVGLVMIGPFLVGGAYLLLYHREIMSEIQWRIENRRLYSNT